MNKARFTQSELDEVAEAIRQAEESTSAEIFAVLARRSDDYRFVAYSFCALWVFLLSALIALWFLWPVDPASQWGRAEGPVYPANWFAGFVAAQTAAFVLIVIVMRLIPGLPVRIAPERITRERARANGIRQFLAHGVDRTSGRNGVLVFVSLEERYAEIFCDKAIEETLGRDFFLGQVEILVTHCASGQVIDGYVTVINALGEQLKTAFPISETDIDELENRFVILPG